MISGTSFSGYIQRVHFVNDELRVWVQAKNQHGSAKSREAVYIRESDTTDNNRNNNNNSSTRCLSDNQKQNNCPGSMEKNDIDLNYLQSHFWVSVSDSRQATPS